MTYAYLRPSSLIYSLTDQREAIAHYCKQHAIHIDQWVEEEQRQTRRLNNQVLTQLLHQVQPQDLVLASAVTILGDSINAFLDTLSLCMRRGASIRTVTDGYDFDNQRQSSSMSQTVAILSCLAREFQGERSKESCAIRRAQGERVGRPYGIHTSPARAKLEADMETLSQCLQASVPRSDIARRFGVSESTLNHFVKDHFRS